MVENLHLIRKLSTNFRFSEIEITVILASFLALSAAQFHNPQFRIQPDSSGFVPSLQQDSSDDQTPSATVNYRQQQSYEYEEDDDEPQQVTPTPNRRQQQPSYLRPTNYNSNNNNNNINAKTKKIIEEELEIEEPDRLSLLLEKSTFNCEGRTG